MRTRGFTLVEVLVTLAILAALAALLIPAVASQVRKADAGRIVADLGSLGSGAEAFLVDVHRHPGDVHDLGTPVSAADTDVAGATYPPGLRARWEGPYVDRAMADGGSIETGFGARIMDDFRLTEHPAGSGVDYLTIRIHGLAAAEFSAVDEALDGGDGPAAGRFHHFAPGDSAHFLALPVD